MVLFSVLLWMFENFSLQKEQYRCQHHWWHMEQLSLFNKIHILPFRICYSTLKLRKDLVMSAQCKHPWIFIHSFISQYILNTYKPGTGVIGVRDMMAVMELVIWGILIKWISYTYDHTYNEYISTVKSVVESWGWSGKAEEKPCRYDLTTELHWPMVGGGAGGGHARCSPGSKTLLRNGNKVDGRSSLSF